MVGGRSDPSGHPVMKEWRIQGGSPRARHPRPLVERNIWNTFLGNFR